MVVQLAMQTTYADHTKTLSPMEPCGGFIWRCRAYTNAAPRPRALRSPLGFHLALQNIHPHHSQTPSPMEPYGASLGYTEHVLRLHPDPEPQLWGSIWRYKTFTQTTRRRGARWTTSVSFGYAKPCTQTTPRPGALRSPMGFTWRYKPYTQTTPRP